MPEPPPPPQCATPTPSPRSRCGWSSSSSVTSSAPRSCGASTSSAPANGAAPATPPRLPVPRGPPDRTPLRDVVAMCLDDWEVRSDTSDEASDDFCAWRVRRRAEPLPSGRGRAQSAPPQPQRARSVLDAARASSESRGRTFRESCVLQ